jgi:hypothetical protein
MMIHFRRNSKGMFRFILSILFILAIPIILSSLLSCRVTMEGEPYHQGPGPAHLSRIEGPWFINANGAPGRLEFYWNGNVWTGRIFLDNHDQWEELMDIFIDPRTGRLEFTRPHGNQRYYGTLSDNRIQGTFIIGGAGSNPWEAWRR